MMKSRVLLYVVGVCSVAATLVTALYVSDPAVDSAHLVPIGVLCALALLAELLAFLLPQSARGSLAYIPYLAAILLSPSWVTCVAVLGIKLIAELPRGLEPVKTIFNIGQHALAAAVGIWVYRLAGGVGLLDVSNASLSNLTDLAGLAAIAAIVASFLCNYIAVFGAIAISTGRPVREVWRTNTAASLGVDVLASPLVFLFSWLYTAYGPFAAAAMWVPILGFRQLTKTNLELEQMNRELLQLMVKSIEARDPYTSGHSRRVQEYAAIIARGLRLSEREIDQISQAALLHDVGKINEKYHPILTKPDKLTSEEWAIMKEHPVDGANLVGTMTRLRHLVPAVRHHHENWDGTGYPDGVAGELIPLDARIIAVADTIDAMTSERPYRPGLSAEQVRAEIVRCRGKQFDPRVADRVLSSDIWSRLFPAEPVRTEESGLRLLKVVEMVG